MVEGEVPDVWLRPGDTVYVQARTPIRYAATRAVWATPTLFINNADNVPVDHQSTLADWQAVIDPLLRD